MIIDIPDPQEPTKDERAEIRKALLGKYEYVSPTYMDRWPPSLWDLSFGPNVLIPLPAALLVQCYENPSRLENLAMSLFFKDLKGHMRGRSTWFVRLNTRSPKDYSYPDLPIARTAKDIKTMLLGSMRVFDDLCFLAAIDKPAFLVLRPVADIHKAYEFRCFVKDRNLIGISQYHYQETFHALDDERVRSWIENAIGQFAPRVISAFKEPNFVFDVFLKQVMQRTAETVLIEVNPWGLSDPCLFGSYDRIEGFLTAGVTS